MLSKCFHFCRSKSRYQYNDSYNERQFYTRLVFFLSGNTDVWINMDVSGTKKGWVGEITGIIESKQERDRGREYFGSAGITRANRHQVVFFIPSWGFQVWFSFSHLLHNVDMSECVLASCGKESHSPHNHNVLPPFRSHVCMNPVIWVVFVLSLSVFACYAICKSQMLVFFIRETQPISPLPPPQKKGFILFELSLHVLLTSWLVYVTYRRRLYMSPFPSFGSGVLTSTP